MKTSSIYMLKKNKLKQKINEVMCNLGKKYIKANKFGIARNENRNIKKYKSKY